MEFDLNKTLEALLLSTTDPIAPKDLVGVFDRHRQRMIETMKAEGESPESGVPEIGIPEKVTETRIVETLEKLTGDAEIEDKAYRVIEGPNGFQIMTAPRFAEWVRLLRGDSRPMKLGPAALETMSIVAYRQPVTRSEIEAIRGVSVDGPLNRLIELELVEATGRAELPGRPIQYGTTDRFLEFTGIKEIADLPASDVLGNGRIDDWLCRNQASVEVVSGREVGLSEESARDDSMLKSEAPENDWQKENAESDAAVEMTDAEENV